MGTIRMSVYVTEESREEGEETMSLSNPAKVPVREGRTENCLPLLYFPTLKLNFHQKLT